VTDAESRAPLGTAGPGPARPRFAHTAAPAGIARRLCAVAYEALLLVALLLIASFVLLPLVSPGMGAAAGTLTLPPLPVRMALFAGLFALCGAYFVWCWTGGRRTLPQKTWHLRIVGGDDRPPARRTAVARYLAAWIGPLAAVAAFAVLQPLALGGHALWLPALNFLWAFVDRDRQFLHDRLAGTRVVRQA
jgi:uncharacterized RDD family membrane protein YckC